MTGAQFEILVDGKPRSYRSPRTASAPILTRAT
jgi:hypothetical protein